MAASHPQKRGSSGKAQLLQGEAAPRLALRPQPVVWHSSTWEVLKVLPSLVPDPNPQSRRERAEDSSQSTGAVLEKGSPTGEGRWARVTLGQLRRGNGKLRAGAAFASRKAQLVNEVGAGTLPQTVEEENSAPVPLGSPPGRAAQSSSARLQPGTQQGICSSSALLCQ